MKNQPPTKQKKQPIATSKPTVLQAQKAAANSPAVYYSIFVIFIMCFVFYGNTLRLKYAYDDIMVITGNQFTKAGFNGIGDILSTDLFTGYFGKDQNVVSGGRYRPLSLVTFAIEYQFFGENPMVSHLVNVLLFALLCIVMFLVIRKMAVSKGYLQKDTPWFLSAPFLITLLFVAHPIHTEVVANIKSRDEILALLFSFLTLYFSIQFIEKRKITFIIFSGLAFFLALLSKENSITFLAIQPIAFYFFTGTKKENNLIATLPLVISTFVFLLIRQSVIGNVTSPLAQDLMNNPFVEMTLSQKYSTILYTLGLYVKLLVFPHPLTSDYYPYHIPIINPSDWRAILPLLLYLGMPVYIILKIRSKSIVAYSLFYFLITISIASNILFPIGAFMNERFLFMPSLAFCILAVAGIVWLQNRLPISISAKKILVFGLMFITLTLYAYKTINRNADWYDSYTLFTTDVKVSANSAKGNETAGEYIMNKASQIQDTVTRKLMLKQSIDYQRKAISIYPKQIIALINLAAAHYQYNKNYDTVLIVYKTILKYLPNDQQIYTFFNSVMGQYNNVDHKIRLYKDLNEVNTERWDVNINLGILYLGGKQDANTALPYLLKAARLKPGDYDAIKYLGTAYAYLSRWKEAMVQLELAESIKPGDAELNGNLAIVYQNLGENEKAQQAKARANVGAKK